MSWHLIKLDLFISVVSIRSILDRIDVLGEFRKWNVSGATGICNIRAEILCILFEARSATPFRIKIFLIESN